MLLLETTLLLCILFILGLYTLLILGFFNDVDIKVIPPPFGRLVVAYRYNGPVAETSIAQLFRYIQNTDTLPYFKTIIIHYYGGRKLTDTEHTRSYAAGVILNEDGLLPDISLVSTLADFGYSIATFPKITHALVVTFPYRNYLSLQLGLSRLYRKLLQYIEHRKLCAYPAIEIYDKKLKIITAIIPLARQDDFYVPEAVPEPETHTGFCTTGSVGDY